ncbi:hypothetical protein BX600DRAFT_527035 [Xylariales sp. PMI_506]|nr:hypothetical protein BX600DRAFT_527035 [Xylariales sp. PMI_506]
MQIMGKSVCDSIKISTYFNVIATSIGIGANIVLAYQGVQALELIAEKLHDMSISLAAQTALRAQKDFANLFLLLRLFKFLPEDIGDFVMKGRINSNKEFVWFNLPSEQMRRYVVDIGHWIPPERGWWDWAKAKFGMAAGPPRLGHLRVLGTRQQENEDADEEDGEGEDNPDDESNGDYRLAAGERNRHHATPLHGRRRRKNRTRHH